MLEDAGMTQSMSRVAHCIDNGPIEGFWGILKREKYYGKRFTSKKELVRMIRDYIFYYNTQRVQRNLGVVTPMEKFQMRRDLSRVFFAGCYSFTERSYCKTGFSPLLFAKYSCEIDGRMFWYADISYLDFSVIPLLC